VSAFKHPYIQANPPHLRIWLIFDVDREGAAFAWESFERPDLRPPNWAAINPVNAFAHLVWGVSAPVLVDSPDMRQAPLRYLCAIEAAYRAALGADQGYSGLLTKNPFHERWKVLWGPPGFYTLAELAECVDLSKHVPKRGAKPEQIGLGRNVGVFDDLRKWAYRHIRDHKALGLPGWNPWMAECNARALGLNGDLMRPMDGREVWHISKSVAKWTWRRFDIAASDARFSRLQAHRGRRGGVASGVVRLAAGEENRASARIMHAQGQSYQQIADALGVSRRSVIYWCNEAVIR
jgi:hypothetical protein